MTSESSGCWAELVPTVRALLAPAVLGIWAATACAPAVASKKPPSVDLSALPGAAAAADHGKADPVSRWWLEPKSVFDVGIEEVRVTSHDGELAILGLERGAVLYQSKGRQRLTLDAKLAARLNWRLFDAPLVGDWLLGNKGPGLLAAFDTRAFEPLWELPLPPEQVFVSVARTGDFAIVETHGGYAPSKRVEQALTGIDARTGRVLWQKLGTSANDQFHGVVAAAGTFWVGAGSDGVQALDPASGALRWSEPRANVQRLFASGTQVVILTQTSLPELETRDAKSGALVAKAKVMAQLRRHALVDGGVLFLVAQGLMAFSVSTLKLLWERPLPHDFTKVDEQSRPSVVAVDGAVVLCEDGTVRAFDRVTGAEVWSYGLDTTPCASLAVVPGPRVFMVRKRDPERPGNDTVIEFAPSAKPAETATIRGRIAPFRDLPLAGAVVTLGTTTVRAQPNGTFEADVTSRGIVRIHADLGIDEEDDEKCNPGAQGDAEVKLSGARYYDALIELARNCK